MKKKTPKILNNFEQISNPNYCQPGHNFTFCHDIQMLLENLLFKNSRINTYLYQYVVIFIHNPIELEVLILHIRHQNHIENREFISLFFFLPASSREENPGLIHHGPPIDYCVINRILSTSQYRHCDDMPLFTGIYLHF